MKLDDGDSIVSVAIAAPTDDCLLTTAQGQCIRFLIEDEVRMFAGRSSDGVRGIRLEDGDRIISMTILRHTEATPDERTAYLKQAANIRRAQNAEAAGEDPDTTPAAEPDDEASGGIAELSPERYAELGAREQFVFTVSTKGFGKRTSSYSIRTSGRGGKGITAMIVNDRNGELIGAFPVEDSDQIMLVTDAGKLIRCPVHDVRIAARSAQGVRIFKTDDAEKVVSVERIPDDGSAVESDGGETPPEAPPGGTAG
jgi:DNA gyrase subunit A